LRVVRDGATILHDIDLTVQSGQIYGLVGPSGSGKTTLIRSIVGLQRITAGRLRVIDRPAGSAELRPKIGYMPQETAIYTDLTARENLEFFAAIEGVAAGRVDAVLQLLDLEAVAGRPAGTYSGGQKRRVALGIALLAEPPVLILDEPTVGLDPRLRHHLWTQFSAWTAAGTTLLVSTHVMDEASHADRLTCLVDGRIVAEGSPDSLLARTGAANLEAAALALTAPDGRQ
jgi:ABC-2 type transport system ATP-binding protein